MFDADPLTREQRLLACWGKTVKGSTDANLFHPALFHMIDVGNVARVLLNEPASPRWRNTLSRSLSIHSDLVSRVIPYLVALHDIGKLSASFQMKSKEQMVRLTNNGFVLGNPFDLPHPVIGQVHIFNETLTVALPHSLKFAVRDMIGGHHGRFAAASEIRNVRQRLRREEHSEWKDLRQAAEIYLARSFLFADESELPEPLNVSTAVMALTGFTILCDWLGSNESFFSPCSGWDLSDYQEESKRRAFTAVEQAGFLKPSFSQTPGKFISLFSDIPSPRPLQSAVDRIPDELLRQPCLTVIEAPTGEGKTEAALALAHRIARITGTDELYYALPTMATSNQMFLRVQKHLYQRLGMDQQVKLIHGQAYLIADDLNARFTTNGEPGSVHAASEWFGPKKRALLAPFGVGTIDQAELGALNVPHVALRLVGLAGKVVIIDEVHAYDTYMTTIIEQLLRWLAALGTYVILLSATLPQSRREALLKAFANRQPLLQDQNNAYPLVVVTGSEKLYFDTPAASQPERVVHIHQLAMTTDDFQRARWLAEQVENGGCACWITNTVERAQRLFKAVAQTAPHDMDKSLLHSQFPLQDRQELEELLVKKYGPGSAARPQRGIVIGTQVIEQSLDLDFDVMVSDLAPVDLLLQRVGRLHRHNRTRPEGHRMPVLWLNACSDERDELEVGVDRFVYEEYILRRTWEVLRGRDALHLPDDYRDLIERVYARPVPEGDTLLARAWQELERKEASAVDQALQRLIPGPDPEDSFASAAARLVFEEREDSAAWNVAQTRLAEESLSVIPLERSGEFVICPTIKDPLRLDQPASRENQLQMLQRNLRVSRKGIVQALKGEIENLPTLFTKSALLKGFVPLFLENGSAEIFHQNRRFTLLLDPQLGLVITNE